MQGNGNIYTMGMFYHVSTTYAREPEASQKTEAADALSAQPCSVPAGTSSRFGLLPHHNLCRAPASTGRAEPSGYTGNS